MKEFTEIKIKRRDEKTFMVGNSFIKDTIELFNYRNLNQKPGSHFKFQGLGNNLCVAHIHA